MSAIKLIWQYGFHPLYRGTWYLTPEEVKGKVVVGTFPSAISRYLVSDLINSLILPDVKVSVSIRYIAVLGI